MRFDDAAGARLGIECFRRTQPQTRGFLLPASDLLYREWIQPVPFKMTALKLPTRAAPTRIIPSDVIPLFWLFVHWPSASMNFGSQPRMTYQSPSHALSYVNARNAPAHILANIRCPISS